MLAAHIDIILAAQKCGLTHVSHILFEGMEGPHIVYDWLSDPRTTTTITTPATRPSCRRSPPGG